MDGFFGRGLRLGEGYMLACVYESLHGEIDAEADGGADGTADVFTS